jgi:hypothetical protein
MNRELQATKLEVLEKQLVRMHRLKWITGGYSLLVFTERPKRRSTSDDHESKRLKSKLNL